MARLRDTGSSVLLEYRKDRVLPFLITGTLAASLQTAWTVDIMVRTQRVLIATALLVTGTSNFRNG